MALRIDAPKPGSDGNVAVAMNWSGYACTGCGCYHMELLDQREQPFAVVMIEPEDLVPFARTLMEMAALMVQAGDLELPVVQ